MIPAKAPKTFGPAGNCIFSAVLASLALALATLPASAEPKSNLSVSVSVKDLHEDADGVHIYCDLIADLSDQKDAWVGWGAAIIIRREIGNEEKLQWIDELSQGHTKGFDDIGVAQLAEDGSFNGKISVPINADSSAPYSWTVWSSGDCRLDVLPSVGDLIVPVKNCNTSPSKAEGVDCVALGTLAETATFQFKRPELGSSSARAD